MTDIVERLHHAARYMRLANRASVHADAAEEAATLIERLRADNARLREALSGLLHHEIGHVGPHAGQRVIDARAAIQETTHGR